MALFRSADPIWLAYSDVETAKRWWIETFDCEQVRIPDDWDDPLPSDVALRLRGEDGPSISLSSKTEADSAHVQRSMGTVPIIYSDKLRKAHEYVASRGVLAGPIQDGGDTQFFEVRDPEGNTIEVCKEP